MVTRVENLPYKKTWNPEEKNIITKAQREKNLGSRVALLPGKFFSSGKFFKKCNKKKLP